MVRLRVCPTFVRELIQSFNYLASFLLCVVWSLAFAPTSSCRFGTSRKSSFALAVGGLVLGVLGHLKLGGGLGGRLRFALDEVPGVVEMLFSGRGSAFRRSSVY